MQIKQIPNKSFRNFGKMELNLEQKEIGLFVLQNYKNITEFHAKNMKNWKF